MPQRESWKTKARRTLRRLIKTGPTMVMLDQTGPFMKLRDVYDLPFSVTIGVIVVSENGFSVGAPAHLHEVLRKRFPDPIWAVAQAGEAERQADGQLHVPWKLEVFAEEE